MGRGGQSATETVTRPRGGKKSESPYERFERKRLRVRYLRSDEEVRAAAAYVKSLDPKVLSLDFETASKNGRFGALNGSLRLIQIGLDEPERGIKPEQLVIDCHSADPSPFLEMLRSRKIEKQIHYMDFEQEWAQLHLGTEINNVYDTCIAGQVIQKKLKALPPEEAEKLLPGWEKHNNKLVTLVDRYLGLEIPKENQSSDWGRTRLAADQVVYAAMDVATLPPLVDELKKISNQVGVSDEVDRRIAYVRRRIRERVEQTQQRATDDSKRIERALKRAKDGEELEQVFSTARQMTVLAPAGKNLRAAYEERQKALRDALPF